ncbi:hypothetical protein [Novipirellula caenicola]|uniref:Uncharacterized protein n=1 Tax=Novipirellula caenicola TaxID=1536901 RepID=A0ABP9VT83_9BACT
MMRKTNVFCLVGLVGLLCQSVAAEEYSKQKTKGSTRVKGTVKVEKKGDTYEININMSTRKSGISGTGKGVVTVQLLDENFEPKKPIHVNKTVGAVPAGTAEKSNSKQILIPADKYEGLIWALDTEDSIGFPTSIGDLKKFIKNTFGQDLDLSTLVKSLNGGQEKSFGDLSVIRLPK